MIVVLTVVVVVNEVGCVWYGDIYIYREREIQRGREEGGGKGENRIHKQRVE